jgi:hypothetical protein
MMDRMERHRQRLARHKLMIVAGEEQRLASLRDQRRRRVVELQARAALPGNDLSAELERERSHLKLVFAEWRDVYNEVMKLRGSIRAEERASA